MKWGLINICWLLLLLNCVSKKSDPKPIAGVLQVSQIRLGTQVLSFTSMSSNTAIDLPVVIDFSSALDTATVSRGIQITLNDTIVKFKISFLNNFQTVSLQPLMLLKNNRKYQLAITSEVRGKNSETFSGVIVTFSTVPAQLKLLSFKIDAVEVLSQNQITAVSLTPSFEFSFSAPLNAQSVASSFFLDNSNNSISISLSLVNQNKTVLVTVNGKLRDLDKFVIAAGSGLQGANSETFIGYSKIFYTKVDPTPKFPIITDTALLALVQQQTLKYFYDFGHPNSGMARERNTSGDVVATGGTGFGLMAMISGIHRSFISRADGITRFNKIISFLETADRFHGAWPHWMNGNTGKVVPFGVNDDGADVVETSYMIQGLLTVRQFLTSSDTVGNNLIKRITTLYNSVEWDWFRKSPAQNVLYWNWSPNSGFAVNVPVRGYNETLITYILAAGSSTHSIPVEVYQQGWANNKSIVNGNSYYGHVLPLGEPYGGPLFFTQYSFLGFDPHVSDPYLNVNFWTQNVNQSLINHDYCVANPHKYVAYSDSCWGLTASDNQNGYSAQSPTNDNGTVSPTAAIASMPYTPTESMGAIKFFYYTLGDRMWGQYGFYDAFNITTGWTATSTLAIDQGPMMVMIENYRTQLLWKLFMSAPEVQAAKTKLGFN